MWAVVWEACQRHYYHTYISLFFNFSKHPSFQSKLPILSAKPIPALHNLPWLLRAVSEWSLFTCLGTALVYYLLIPYTHQSNRAQEMTKSRTLEGRNTKGSVERQWDVFIEKENRSVRGGFPMCPTLAPPLKYISITTGAILFSWLPSPLSLKFRPGGAEKVHLSVLGKWRGSGSFLIPCKYVCVGSLPKVFPK